MSVPFIQQCFLFQLSTEDVDDAAVAAVHAVEPTNSDVLEQDAPSASATEQSAFVESAPPPIASEQAPAVDGQPSHLLFFKHTFNHHPVIVI